VPIFPRGHGRVITEEFCGELWGLVFNVPHLAGYDDPHNPWWPLREDEKEALAVPTARWLETLSPATQELINRVGAPVALVLTVAALASWRIEMSRMMLREMRIAREMEARRAGLARGLEDSNAAVVGRVDGSHSAARTGASSRVDAASAGHLKNLFDTAS
jgi:hypothetical protein